MNTSTDPLVLYGQTFHSRLLLGTSRYPSPAVLARAVEVSRPAMLTASLRRQTAQGVAASREFFQLLRDTGVAVLPNTAGCHSLQEAITTAEMAREVFETDWIKLELIGDDYTLQPDTLQLPQAAEKLIRIGFKVLPYSTDDLVLCQRLVDVGCQAVMPWAAPIGTGKGPINPYAMRTLREILLSGRIGELCSIHIGGQHPLLLGRRPAWYFVPGQHGKDRKAKIVGYGLQLREKQKARRYYQVLEGQFRNLFEKAATTKGITGEVMLQMLERRLDNAIYRIGFATSRAGARQLVRHGHVHVNGRKVNIPSFQVKAGDEVTIRDKSKENPAVLAAREATAHLPSPSWLEIDRENLKARVIGNPKREELVQINLNEQLIVELYSK